MGEKEKLVFSDSPNMTELSAEDIAALEAERKAAREAELAPAKKAADMRKENAKVIAEHDDMLAELLFEITVNEMEG